MMLAKLKVPVGLLLLWALLSACGHYVGFNAPQNYNYDTRVAADALFYMDSTQRAVMWSGRSAAAGIANRWDVPVGQTVHTYALAYLQGGFRSFTDIPTLDNKPRHDLLIKITRIQYHMANQAAHVTIDFVVENPAGKAVFTKTYQADGPSQKGKAFWGGATAQKSVIRQSTHVALEQIFTSFMRDMREQRLR